MNQQNTSTPTNRTLKLGVAGGQRGGSFERTMEFLAERITLTAICDPDDNVRNKWSQSYPDIKAYSEFNKILEDPNVDAILIATPMTLHAQQSIDALNAGKHVLSEVIATTTLEECWELVETVEKTGLTYMMAENYCYRRDVMMVKNMIDKGLFGTLTFAEGAYIHDCRALLLNADFSRTWRGIMRGTNGQISRGNGYPTHSLGPVAQWLGVNRTDRLLRTTTFVTASIARHEWARSVLPPGHPDAKATAWQNSADSATTIIETELGRVISLRYDSASPRPHNMADYGLQGTNGAYMSGRHDREDPLIWIDRVSEGVSPFISRDNNRYARPDRFLESGPAKWESLWEFADEFEHPDWLEYGQEALKSGHSGGDFFVLQSFVESIATGEAPPIDVYDAVTWSCITPLSVENVRRNGEPTEIPDFKHKKR